MKNLGLVVAGSILSLSAFAQDGVTVGGYVDAGFTSIMQDKSLGADVQDKHGFLVREGAIYLGKKWGTEWEVFGDFSFGQNFNAATNNPAAIGGVAVSQAFVAQSMDNGFSWKLGQFDGIFGYYAGRKDSHAHRLTNTGYIQNAYLPAAHLGWLASYSFSDMLKFNLLVANEDETFGPDAANGTGGGALAGGTTNGTQNADVGILVNADFDAFSADVGAYIMTGETGTSRETEAGYVVSAVVEGNFNPLTFGVFGVYFKNDSKAGTGMKDEADFGIGANVGYDINEQLGADLRIEYVGMSDKLAFYNNGAWANIAVTEVNSVMAGTIGGHYKFNDNVKAKVDFSYMTVDVDVTGDDVDPIMMLNAGVVANF